MEFVLEEFKIGWTFYEQQELLRGKLYHEQLKSKSIRIFYLLFLMQYCMLFSYFMIMVD